MTNVSSWISTLFAVMQVEETPNPVIHFLVHGKHDGANFECMHHSIRKLHPFVYACACCLFPYSYYANQSFYYYPDFSLWPFPFARAVKKVTDFFRHAQLFTYFMSMH